MAVIIVLMIISVVVAGGFLISFILAVRSGQYDDTYGPSVRMLFDTTAAKDSLHLSGTKKPQKEGVEKSKV